MVKSWSNFNVEGNADITYENLLGSNSKIAEYFKSEKTTG